jgi:O-antigen/teichoic acid export membrane protein
LANKLILNSVSGTVLYAVNVVVAFVISPVLIRSLGNRDYGLWELVMGVIGYMGLLDLGIGQALVQFVSLADGKKDRDNLQQTISTAFAFFALIGVVAVVIFAILSRYPSLIIGNQTDKIASVGTIFLLLGLNASMLFPLQVFLATLMGLQRHYFINNVRIVYAILRACLVLKLLHFFPGKGLVVLALLEPLFTSVQLILFAGVVHLDKKIPNISLAAVSPRKAKEMLGFAAKSATMLVASRLQSQSVPLIIGNVIGLSQIVYFVMPNRLIDYARGISLAIGFPLTPYFGATVGRGNHDDLVKSWLDTTLALQTVSLAMPVLIFFLGEPFIGLWLGHEYAVAGRTLLYILLAGLVADSLASNAFRVLTAQGKHGRCAMSWLVFAGLSIPLGILGAHQWGLAGVAAATTVVAVLGHSVTIFLACSALRVSLFTYFRRTLGRTALPLLLLAGTLWWLNAHCRLGSYPDLALQAIVSGSVYVLAVWCFTLKPEVRINLWSRVKLSVTSLAK